MLRSDSKQQSRSVNFSLGLVTYRWLVVQPRQLQGEIQMLWGFSGMHHIVRFTLIRIYVKRKKPREFVGEDLAMQITDWSTLSRNHGHHQTRMLCPSIDKIHHN